MPLTLETPTSPADVPAPTIAPPTTPVNRVKLATDIFNTTADATQGAYDAASRDNIHRSAAFGQIGSGGLRTREGNLQLARARDLDVMRRDLVNKATEGSVADASTAFQQSLAGSQQALASELGRGNLQLARDTQTTSANQNQQQIDLARRQQEINTQFEQGRLTLAQRDEALRELTQSQSNTAEQERLRLAREAQTTTAAQEADRIAIAREQVRNQATQFGATQAQQLALAQLADRTANRQIDVSTTQGQNTLLLELARIMGGPTGNVDPAFVAAIAHALGVTLPAVTAPPTTTPPTTYDPTYHPPTTTPGSTAPPPNTEA